MSENGPVSRATVHGDWAPVGVFPTALPIRVHYHDCLSSRGSEPSAVANLPNNPQLSFDCVVVGGGVAGATVALALANRNVRVLVVDEGEDGGEATIQAGALLAPQFSVPLRSPLFSWAMEGFHRFPEYARELYDLQRMDMPVRRKGIFVANLDEAHAEAARGVVEAHVAQGLHAELVEAADAAQSGACTGGAALSYIWFPDASVVPGRLLARALYAALVAKGVSLLQGMRVRRVTGRGGRATGVELAGGNRVAAGSVVIAAGLGTRLVAGLPRQIPVQGEAVHVVRGGTWRPDLRPVLGTPEGAWVARLPNGVGIAAQLGGGLGMGLRPADVAHGSLRSLVASLVGTELNRGTKRSFRGHLPVGGDGLPFAGVDPDVSGLAYATGYGSCGFLLAPVLGEAVARDVLGSTPDTRLLPFRPDRLASCA